MTQPTSIAKGISNQIGMTLPGNLVNSRAMTMAKTALTIKSSRKMTIMNSVRVRFDTTTSVRAPIERALWRAEIHRVPKSWMPAKKMVPRTTHRSAGSHPQKTAIAGPTIGAAPATEVK